MPLIMKDGKAYGQSPSGLSGLIDTDIQNPTQGEVLAVDSNGKWANTTLIEAKRIQGTTDANGFLTTNLLAKDYAFLGLKDSISHFAISLNAQSDGTIRLQMRNSSFTSVANGSFDFYAWFIHIV